MLVLSGSRAASLESPYLDVYGEEDRDLASGRIRYLFAKRWQRFESLWRTGAFEFDSLILQTTQGGRSAHGAQVM